MASAVSHVSLRECKHGFNCPFAQFGVHRNSEYHSILEANTVSKADVDKQKPFTSKLLQSIQDYPGDKDIYMRKLIMNDFNKGNKLLNACVVASFPTTDSNIPFANHFVPSRNSLYFLFLANLYCDYQTYLSEFPFLPEFLFICDQEGLTGQFAIDKHLYKKLFGNCDMHGGYEIAYGYFLLSNSSIRLDKSMGNMDEFLSDPSPLDTAAIMPYKTTAHTAIQKSVASQVASQAASHTFSVPKVPNPHPSGKTPSGKTRCKHGENCKSLGRVKKGTTYKPDLSHVSEYEHAGGKKTKKRSTKKQTKKHTKKRNKKTRKHYIKRK